MPLGNREYFQLGLLLLCVPVQVFLTIYLKNPLGRKTAVFGVLNDIRGVKDYLISADVWKQRWNKLVTSLVEVYFPELTDSLILKEYNDPDMCPAVEVLRYNRKAGYFASSTEVRSWRALHVKYRVGQVVRHRDKGYRAVIVGWDMIPKAPISWLDKTHGDDMFSREWPHYLLLVDKRDIMHLEEDDYVKYSSGPVTYVVQEALELLKNTEISNPDVEKKFQQFDGAQYLPGPSLKAVYPRD